MHGLLARGEFAALREAVGSFPPADHTLVLRIADLDAAVHVDTSDLTIIEGLRYEVCTNELRWWLDTILAEHFMWKGDLAVTVETARYGRSTACRATPA